MNDNLDSNDQYDMSIQSRHNQQGLNHSQPKQKRVQIIDHNRRTPSTDYVSERDSHEPYTPEFNQNQEKLKPRRDHMDDNKSNATHESTKQTNNFKIHEYLYGLSAPDPGS